MALADAILDLSEAYLYAARLDDALSLLNSDVVMLVAGDMAPADRVRLQIQRARIMLYKNKLKGASNDAAWEVLVEAEEIARSLDAKELLADVANLMGLVSYGKELWSTTLETSRGYFEQALALSREIDSEKRVAESLFNLGTAHQNRKGRTEEDLENAFHCFQEVYRLAEEKGFLWQKAHAARHLGYIYGHHKRDRRTALSYHREFLEVNQEIQFRFCLPGAHTMVGFAYFELQDHDSALQHFESAHALAEEMGYQQPWAEALLGLGLVEEERGDTHAAVEHYRQALALAQPIGLRPVIRIANIRLEALETKEGEEGRGR